MARKPLPRNLTPTVRNILTTFYDASNDELAYGMGWYPMAQSIARDLCPEFPEIGAGVLAALSPQTGWDQNVDLARRAFRQGEATHTTYERARKADAIMNSLGAPLDILGGPKVRAFYRAIMGEHDAVVIDRHAFDVAVGRVTDDATRNVLRRAGVYERFAGTYVRAARVLALETDGAFDVSPAALQAVTWVVWRRQKGLS